MTSSTILKSMLRIASSWLKPAIIIKEKRCYIHRIREERLFPIISFQAFKPGFEDKLLEIRNHPRVRQYMMNPVPIEPESHYQWISDNVNLLNPEKGSTLLALIKVDDDYPGFVLVRDIKGQQGEIGIMIKDSDVNLGLGAIAGALALERLCFNYLGLKSVIAKTSILNRAVLGLWRGLGASSLPSDDKDLSWCILRLENTRSNPTYQRILKKYGHHGKLLL